MVVITAKFFFFFFFVFVGYLDFNKGGFFGIWIFDVSVLEELQKFGYRMLVVGNSMLASNFN